MAIIRKPKPGLIVQSDRGVQYASHIYRQLLCQHQCIGSMSCKGNCWDNAVAESFFGSLKQERLLDHVTYLSLEENVRAIENLKM